MGELGFNWGKNWKPRKSKSKTKSTSFWSRNFDDDKTTKSKFTANKYGYSTGYGNYYDVNNRRDSYQSTGWSYNGWSEYSRNTLVDPTQYISPKYKDVTIRIVSFNILIFLDSLIQTSLLKQKNYNKSASNDVDYSISRNHYNLKNLLRSIKRNTAGLNDDLNKRWLSSLNSYLQGHILWSFLSATESYTNQYGSNTLLGDILKNSILGLSVDLFKAYFIDSSDLFIDLSSNPQKARLLEKAMNSLMKGITINKLYMSYSMSALYCKYIYTMLTKFKNKLDSGKQDDYSIKSIDTVLTDLLVKEKTSYTDSSDERKLQKDFVDFYEQEMQNPETEEQFKQDAETAISQGEAGEKEGEASGNNAETLMKLEQGNASDSKDSKDLSEVEKQEAKSKKKSDGDALGKLAGTGHDVISNQIMETIIDVQKSDISSFLNSSLEFVNSSVTKVYRNYEVGILDADSITDLDDLEMLMPKLRNVFLDQLSTQEMEYFFKINIYIDVSGSMEEVVSLGKGRVALSSIARSLVIQLKRLNIVNHVFFFDSKVYTAPDISGDLSEKQILSFHRTGGTSFGNLFIHWEENDKHASVVITDGEDYLGSHAEGLHWIGLNSNLSGISPLYHKAGVAASFTTADNSFKVLST